MGAESVLSNNLQFITSSTLPESPHLLDQVRSLRVKLTILTMNNEREIANEVLGGGFFYSDQW